MTMSGAVQICANPVVEYREQVALLCKKFTRATGWTVRFIGEPPAASDESFAGEVFSSSLDQMGRIELLLPAKVGSQTRRRAESATELLVEMVEQLGVSWRDLHRRDDDVQRLVEISETVTCSDDRPDAVPVLLRAAIELTRTQSASFHLLDRDRKRLFLRGQSSLEGDLPLEVDLVRELEASPVDMKVLVDGPIDVEFGTATETGQGGRCPEWLPSGTAAAACVPVLGSDGPLGTIWVHTCRAGRISSEQVILLQSAARQLGGLLDRLAIRGEQAIRDRIMSELEGLSESQSGEQLGILPSGTGFEVVGRCCSRYEVGGDLCEMVPLTESRTLVAVGDACGHSVQAAFVMTAVRSAMSAVLDDRDAAEVSPAEVVARLNRALCRVTAGHQFMSCLVGIVDSDLMTFEYSNAGHPVPILFRDGDCHSMESHGMPLGIIPDAEYTSGKMALRGADVLVLFTDGVFETMNSRRELFRTEGVIKAIGSGEAGESIGVMLDRIWDTSEAHGEGPTEDDKTLLILRMQQKAGVRPPHHDRKDRVLRQKSAANAVSSRCS
jgi:sigma-B regulation protein RsbU (phosphoserine phosphatase)